MTSDRCQQQFRELEQLNMLQNPSKYHTNPLSHFLALHSSQQHQQQQQQQQAARNNAISNGLNSASHILTNVSAFGHGSFQPQQQQTQQQPKQQHSKQQGEEHTPTTTTTTSTPTPTTTHAHQYLDATGTTLDVGKSFTIAAILGLQSRNGMEQSRRKEYNSVINLSLNGGGGDGSTPPMNADDLNKSEDTSNGDNNSKFHCDNNNVLVNSYQSPTTTTTSNNMHQQHHQHHQQTQHHHQTLHHHHQHNQHHHHQPQHSLMSTHIRANSFAAAAAVAAVNAVVNGTPTALQSLQQLHHHHAQQTSLSFSRDKLKADNHTKKSSMKNKRVRTIFTPEQLERLEAEFERQQYMVGPERLYLAHTLQLTEAQVKVWFQNRRIKWRKHHLELTQQRLALLRQSQLPASNSVVGAGLNSLPSPDALVTAASNSSFDDNDEPHVKSEEGEPLTNSQRSTHTESESELSVCNDSMDGDSINDGGGDT